jgi:hypothetical protein
VYATVQVFSVGICVSRGAIALGVPLSTSAMSAQPQLHMTCQLQPLACCRRATSIMSRVALRTPAGEAQMEAVH